LRPHRPLDRADELYQTFASAARVVIHHSEWGRRVVTDRFRFRDDAVHVVLPHGHFGDVGASAGQSDRVTVEAELGIAPCALRIAIVGAPRVDKQTTAFMRAFAATTRSDVQLLVLSLADHDEVPDDPRIVAKPYEFVPRAEYNRRLSAVDVIALPFDPDGQMLTTGVVADVVGLGLPAIVSEWPYLRETLGDAALSYSSGAELTALIDSLSATQLQEARQGSIARQQAMSWQNIASQFFDVIVDAGVIKR
jgi:hypothetical protein